MFQQSWLFIVINLLCSLSKVTTRWYHRKIISILVLPMGKVLGKATSICGGANFCLNYKIRITALLKMDTITDTFLGI